MALQSTQSGLLLWYSQVVPTLLPFILISNLLIKLDCIHYLTFFITPFLKRIFSISSNGSFAVLIGLFCGYPMGAKVVSDLYSTEKLSKKEACYLLIFINNASPAFILNFVINNFFPREFIIALIIYGSTFIIAFTAHIFFYKSFSNACPYRTSNLIVCQIPLKKQLENNFNILDNCITDTFETLIKLAGYIILFALLGTIISQLSFLPLSIRHIIILYLEITSGISHINSADLNHNLQFILTVSAAAFGGVSCLMQSTSFLKSTDLPLKPLIIGKIVSGIICLLMAIVIINLH